VGQLSGIANLAGLLALLPGAQASTRAGGRRKALVVLVGGVIGSLLVGVFADTAFNANGANGLIESGSFHLLGEQAIAVGVTLVWSFVMTAVILLALKRLLPAGIRVSEEDEDTGLDLTQHTEVGYALDRA